MGEAITKVIAELAAARQADQERLDRQYPIEQWTPERQRMACEWTGVTLTYKMGSENSPDEELLSVAKGFRDALAHIESLESEIAKLKRGEYICRECGIRKDGEHEKGEF